MTPRLRLTLRRLATYFLVWTAMGLFMFSQGAIQKITSNDPNPWWQHLTSWMVGVYIWFLITPLVLWLGDRLPFERRIWVRRLFTHLGLALAVAILQLSVESAVLRAIGVFPMLMTSYVATLAFLFVIGFHQSILTYWIILSVQYAFSWYRRYQERQQETLRLELRSSQLEGQLVQARLSALKSQLQPHFLFNTLNAIMVLVRQQKGREAEEMLGRLSDLLRCVLDDAEAQEIPLRRELQYLDLYLSIEQVRFQDRLRVEIAADPEVLDAAVPQMILQPLVENAIRHGIGRASSAGRLRISACYAPHGPGNVEHGALELKVEDDGPGLAPPGPNQARGIGLANTRDRLRQLYGDAARLSVENAPPGGVAATVTLPFSGAAPPRQPELMETHADHRVAG